MYDLAVIGAGWAGFNASLRARDLGLKVVLIDKHLLGGTCLNSGCIPTKALIQSAKVFAAVKKSSVFGIGLSNPSCDFLKIQERKNRVIEQLRCGMQSLLKGVEYLSGPAILISRNEIEVLGKVIQAKNILISSGSRPFELPTLKFDAKKVLSSNEILSLEKIPESLLIVGGGVIGCEFASLFAALGSKITIAEKMPQLLPGEDREVAKKIESVFRKKGIKVNTGIDASSFNTNDFELVLVSVGRTPQIEDLGLEGLGVNLEKGRIVTDEYLTTNINNIYASGDCTAKVMLAHFASFQGIIAAHNIANPSNKIKALPVNIPNCIFTDPEIASVGLTEEKATVAGMGFIVHKFDFMGSGMARILDETEGFIKVISDRQNGLILGASIIGPKATELIGIFGLALANNLHIENLRSTIFSHPTLSEAIGEAVK